jgi:hypothetical protein
MGQEGPTLAIRTGIVALTLVVKHLCHILVTWRVAIDGVLAAAVGSGVITNTQKEIVDTFLNQATTACDILRAVTGY